MNGYIFLFKQVQESSKCFKEFQKSEKYILRFF